MPETAVIPDWFKSFQPPPAQVASPTWDFNNAAPPSQSLQDAAPIASRQSASVPDWFKAFQQTPMNDQPGITQPSVKSPPEDSGGIARNLGAGLNEGVAGMAAFPLQMGAAVPDAMQAEVMSSSPYLMMGGKAPEPVPSMAPVQERAQQLLTHMGLPNPADVTASTDAEKLARNVGRFGSQAPLAAIGAPGVGAAAASVARSVPALAGGAVGATVGGNLGGPAGEFVGGLIGMPAGAGAAELARASAKTAARATGIVPKETLQPAPKAEPITATKEQQQAAVDRVRFESPGMQEALNTPVEPTSVPLTTAQTIKPANLRIDEGEVSPKSLMGAVKLETSSRLNQDPAAKYGATAFQARDLEQNSAMLADLKGAAPADAKPETLGQFFVNRANQIDQEGEAATRTAENAAAQSTAGLPSASLSEAGARAGAMAREGEVNARQRASEQFWQKVDPDQRIGVDMSGPKEIASKIEQSAAATGGLHPGEKAIIQELTGPQAIYGDTAPLITQKDPETGLISPIPSAHGLTSRIAAVQRELQSAIGGDGQGTARIAASRLGVLKTAVEDAMSKGFDRQIAGETAAVSAGQMTPEQTMLSRLMQQKEDWYAGQGAGQTAVARAGGNAAARSGPVRPALGDQGPARMRPSEPSGGAGMAPGGEPSAYAAEAVGRLKQARYETAKVEATYTKGPFGRMLQDFRNGKVMNEGLAARTFLPGKDAPEMMRRFTAAVPDRAEAEAVATEALVADLRKRGILMPDGRVPDAGKLAAWHRNHEGTISQIPGLAEKFRTVEQAAETAANTAKAARQRALEYRNGIARGYLSQDPDVAIRDAISGKNSAGNLNKLIEETKGDQEAQDSLRHHVVHELMDKFAPELTLEKTDGIQTANRRDIAKLPLKKWLSENREPIVRLFGGQGMQNIERVMSTLKRMELPKPAVAGSQTASNLGNTIKEAAHHPTAHTMAIGAIGEIIGHMTGAGEMGAVTAIAASPLINHIIKTVAQNGIRTQKDIIGAMMLHPEFAKLMLQKYPERIPKAAMSKLTTQIVASLARNAGENKKDSTNE